MQEKSILYVTNLLVTYKMDPMKKILLIAFIFTTIIGMSSCDYDDSNDIDILKPNDSTATGIMNSEDIG